MPRSRRETFLRLYEVAQRQAGFFTAKQAVAAGFSRSGHAHHVRAGNWVREHRGIYRLALLPAGEHSDLTLWGLWSSNLDGQVEGVYSYKTALGLQYPSSWRSMKLHMTVPERFRRNSRIPTALALHTADLPKGDVIAANGYKFTRPLRTILDLAIADTLPRSFLREALLHMIEQGLIPKKELDRARIPAEPRRLFEMLLRQ